ncbi:MAG: 3-deoxy-manno-octulosonate cytidylyltransferase [Cytophagales bacterium]|nr:3-deoxy-manno-octulosonate cytidylyltransferase [Cytophagales bacterium]
MKIVGIIPSRYESSRFPGKPLADIQGKSMIQRVYEQAQKAESLSEVYVATDDERIFEHVQSFGGKVVMTSTEHPTGTDRCQEAYEKAFPSADFIINIQGDEPFIKPEQIDLLASCLSDDRVELATLVKEIDDYETLFNVNTPKVVITTEYFARYFSRQTIPYLRNIEDKSTWLEHHTFYKHIGIYAYRADVLPKITKLVPSSLELAESLEQLRWLENGYKIKVAVTEFETIGIDTPEDLEKVKELL